MILERIRFMKVNKHKRFEFTPRYYDERKDRIQKIRDSYSDAEGKTPTEQEAQMRERMQSAWNSEKSYSNQARIANVRVILILVALLFATYMILGYVDTFAAEVIDLDK
ncbi:MAG TPA: hypothetical protein VL021_10115 [Brumimicrobium sp.]|nr:hypothetical protein [Brumimicrobium sp.]